MSITEQSFQEYTTVHTVVPVMHVPSSQCDGYRIVAMDEGDHWLLCCDFDQIVCNQFADVVQNASNWLEVGNF